MSLYDRPYMKDDAPSAGAALFRRAGGVSATSALIFVNVAVFLLWQIAGPSEWMLRLFTCSADGVLREGRVWTLVTAAFSHFDFWHLFFNLFFFWMIARDLEEMLGAKEILALYLVSGVVASLGHVAAMEIAGTPQIPALGASGAVMATMVLFACYFPRRKFLIWGLLPIEARWMALGYIVLDVAGAVRTGDQSHVAHAAHLAGAVVGFLWWRVPIRLFPGGRFRFAPRARRAEPGVLRREPDHGTFRAPHAGPQGPPRGAPREATVDARRLDQILEKVARVGIAELTEDEKRDLLRASRDRRGE